MHEHDDDPASPQSAVGVTHIDVDVSGLNDFRGFLVRELDTNLKPGSQGIANDHGLGVQFGVRNVGVHVQVARQRYHESLQNATSNLTAYVETAEIIIDALHRVAAKYTAADLSSAGSAARIDTALSAAATDAITARNAADQHANDLETQRERHRMNAGSGG